LHELKKSERSRKERIKELQGNIEKIQQNIDNPPEVEDPDAIEADRVSQFFAPFVLVSELTGIVFRTAESVEN
jgi:hypothetical protein